MKIAKAAVARADFLLAFAAEGCYNTRNNSDEGDHAVHKPALQRRRPWKNGFPYSGLEGAARQDMEFAPELPC